MRLVLCAVSAIALSGCSWLGNGSGQYGQSYGASSHHGSYKHASKMQNPCQIATPQQAIPRGCRPEQVSIGTQQSFSNNGFPQKPSFGNAGYATAGYGSHAGVAGQQGANYQSSGPKLRKPSFRGSLSLGGEKSINGDVLFIDNLAVKPSASYDPRDFNEGTLSGSPADGQTVRTVYTAGPRDRSNGALWDNINQPNVSFDDAWSTPARIAVGGEYILSPKNTVFANVGYSAAEGKTTNLQTVEATLYRDITTQDFDDTGAALGGPVTSSSFIPNQDVARFSADFTDMKRLDLEVGGRHYFNSWNKTGGLNTVTPFVGAAVGASRYNGVSYRLNQEQRFYGRAFENPDDAANQFYDISVPDTSVTLYDSQWVPSGQLNAGVEWQVTPKTGLAFETGVRLEGARTYSNEVKGDSNIAIPFTIRGSYNF